MRVKMLADAPGSPDGIEVNEYEKGDVYDVTDSLGDAFLAHGVAENLDVKAKTTKKAAGPSENKSS